MPHRMSNGNSNNDGSNLWCLICNVMFQNRQEADVHFSSPYHFERVRYCKFHTKAIERSKGLPGVCPEGRTLAPPPAQQQYANNLWATTRTWKNNSNAQQNQTYSQCTTVEESPCTTRAVTLDSSSEPDSPGAADDGLVRVAPSSQNIQPNIRKTKLNKKRKKKQKLAAKQRKNNPGSDAQENLDKASVIPGTGFKYHTDWQEETQREWAEDNNFNNIEKNNPSDPCTLNVQNSNWDNQEAGPVDSVEQLEKDVWGKKTDENWSRATWQYLQLHNTLPPPNMHNSQPNMQQNRYNSNFRRQNAWNAAPGTSKAPQTMWVDGHGYCKVNNTTADKWNDRRVSENSTPASTTSIDSSKTGSSGFHRNWTNGPNDSYQQNQTQRNNGYMEQRYQNYRMDKVQISDSVKGIYVHRNDLKAIPTEELHEFFSKFGKILSIKRPDKEKPYCFVNFDTNAAVQDVLKTPVYLRGKFLRVASQLTKQSEKQEDKTKIQLNNEEKYMEFDLACLNQEGKTFDEDLDNFIKIIEQDPDVYRKQVVVCKDLERVFNPILPGVTARLFGSSITGLGFKDSDTDVFMDCPISQPPRNFVAKKTGVMFTSGCFKDVLKISQARVPIVRFTHVETGLSSDVTFLNKLGVKNSQLIRFITSLDPRIRQMMIVVKYWARCQGLSAVGKFSNYSLTVMVIFFLQQLDKPLLPSIRYLQSVATEKDYCEFWDCSFCTDKSAVPQSQNKDSVKELLFQFFKFYSYFDFSEYIVCPFLGKPFEISKFKDYGNLPSEFDRYKYYCEVIKKDEEQKPLKLNVMMVVQDPFDLSYNVTKCINSKLFSKFHWYCEYVRDKIFRKLDEKILMNLFLLPIESPPMERFGGPKGLYKITICMDNVCLSNVDGKTKGEEYKILWFKAVQYAAFTIFKNICLMELKSDKKSPPPTCEYSHKAYKIVQIVGEGSAEIFRGRKQMKKQVNVSGGKKKEFYTECSVSRALLNQQKKLEEIKAKEGKPEKEICTGRYYLALKFICEPNADRPRLTIELHDRSTSSSKDPKGSNFRTFVSLITPLFEHYVKLTLPDVFDCFHLLTTDPDFGNDIQEVIFDDNYLNRYINGKVTSSSTNGILCEPSKKKKNNTKLAMINNSVPNRNITSQPQSLPNESVKPNPADKLMGAILKCDKS